MCSSQAVQLYPLALYHLLKNFFTHLTFKNLLVERIKKFPIPIDFAIQHHFVSNSCDRLFEGIIRLGTKYICVAVPTLH